MLGTLLGNAPLKFSSVYHVGSNPTGRKPRKGSAPHHIMLEGRELSVSLHPAAWRRIAALTGTTWRGRNTAGRFLDAYAARDRAQAWCLKNGFLAQRAVWRVTRFDEELDEETHADYSTRKQAEAAEGESGERVQVQGFGPAGLDYYKLTATGPVQHELATAWAPIFYARGLGTMDGVWWDEDLDVENHSAPRGCILWEHVHRWVWSRTEFEGES